MGTYLYFGKISKTKTDAKIVISNKGNFMPVEDIDSLDYFFGRIPSSLIPKEMEYHYFEKMFFDKDKTKEAYSLLVANGIISENGDEIVRILARKRFLYLKCRCITKTSSFPLEIDFYEEPFVLTIKNIDRYLADFRKNIDEEEELKCIEYNLSKIKEEISSGEVWFNLNAEKRNRGAR